MRNPSREELDDAANGVHDQLNAGRFERVQEAAGQTDRDHVLAPALAAHAVVNDEARAVERLAVQARMSCRPASSSLMKLLQ